MADKPPKPGDLWKDDPEPHDYDAAQDYLSLVLPPAVAEATVKKLRAATIEHRKAKDILRASGLPLLAKDNVHVSGDLDKVKDGKKMSPVLLVRGDARAGSHLTIADGYHRVCAGVYLEENVEIACRIADIAKS